METRVQRRYAPIKAAGVVKNPVNLTKQSVTLRASGETGCQDLEFYIDASVDCLVRVYCNAQEMVDEKKVPSFAPLSDPVESKKFPFRRIEKHFPAGLMQKVVLDGADAIDVKNVIDYKEEEVGKLPIAIELVPSGTDLSPSSVQGQYTYVVVKQPKPGNSPTKSDPVGIIMLVNQKVKFKERGFSLYEIYGVHSKGGTDSDMSRGDEAGRECIICLSEERDVAVFPCRHMCLCLTCSQNLTRTSSTTHCPICRRTVSTFLQVNCEGPKELDTPNEENAKEEKPRLFDPIPMQMPSREDG